MKSIIQFNQPNPLTPPNPHNTFSTLNPKDMSIVSLKTEEIHPDSKKFEHSANPTVIQFSTPKEKNQAVKG